jgi:hypothetical protein
MYWDRYPQVGGSAGRNVVSSFTKMDAQKKAGMYGLELMMHLRKECKSIDESVKWVSLIRMKQLLSLP